MNLKVLRLIIETSDITKQDLARELNMSNECLDARLNNEIQFSLGNIYKMVNIFNIDDPIILLTDW